MNDTFLRWFLRLWFGALIVAAVQWLWRLSPPGLVGTAVLAGLAARAAVVEGRRRRSRGYWVEYVGPAMLRAGADEFAAIYHGGDGQHFFHGTVGCYPVPDVLTVPGPAAWRTHVPPWMAGRRTEILARVIQELHSYRLRLAGIADE